MLINIQAIQEQLNLNVLYWFDFDFKAKQNKLLSFFQINLFSALIIFLELKTLSLFSNRKNIRLNYSFLNEKIFNAFSFE